MVTVLTMDLGTTVFAVPSDEENIALSGENTSSDPSQVYSEEYTPVTTQEPQILSEVEEERSESSKTFLMNDGTFLYAQYANPVHYEDADGEWQNIDTTLVEEIADSEDPDGAYSTTEKAGRESIVKFSKKLKEGKTVSIKHIKYPLSWGLVGAEKQRITIEEAESDEVTGNNKFL